MRILPVRWLVLLALLAGALALAACGGDDEEQGGGQAAQGQAESGEAAVQIKPYTGFEAQYPKEYAAPTRAGQAVRIGYLNPLAANESLASMQDAAEAEAKRLGATLVPLDDKLDVNKQVSDFEQLLGQDVDAVIFYPLDPGALSRKLRDAERQGVPTVGIDVTFEQGEWPKDVDTQVIQGRDTQAYTQVQALAKIKPGAKVGLIGIGAPVPALKYYAERVKHWAGQAGLRIVGQQDNPTDDAAGGEQAMNGLLGQASDMDAVIAYNDPSALGAYAAARAQGRRDITFIGLNGGQDGLGGVENGRLAATVGTDPVNLGRQALRAAYVLATQKGADVPPTVIRGPHLVTKANVAQQEPWPQQVAKIK